MLKFWMLDLVFFLGGGGWGMMCGVWCVDWTVGGTIFKYSDIVFSFPPPR